MSLHEQQIDNLISAHTELSKRLTEAEATAAMVPGLREEIERLKEILERVVDGEDCRIDHNGFCQTHYSDEPCTNALMRQVLND